MPRQTHGQGANGQGRVGPAVGGKHRGAGDKQIVHGMDAAVFVDDAGLWAGRHARRAGVVNAAAKIARKQGGGGFLGPIVEPGAGDIEPRQLGGDGTDQNIDAFAVQLRELPGKLGMPQAEGIPRVR